MVTAKTAIAVHVVGPGSCSHSHRGEDDPVSRSPKMRARSVVVMAAPERVGPQAA